MTDKIQIFDRRAVRAHRNRASALPEDARFLRLAVQERLVDRLDEVKPRFTQILDLGSGDATLAPLLAAAGRGAALVVSVDSAPGFARRGPNAVVAEEEALPFRPGSFDLVISTLGLHWTNDLPGALWQIREILRPDGLLLAAMFGGQTLWELREVLMQAEIEICEGAGQHISPYADVRDAGMLLQRAGFALPVVDSEMLTVTYPNALALMRDLRAMGETNATLQRQSLRRDVLMRASTLYHERFGLGDGRIPASFQVITVTGWSPSPTQPKPLARGSAKTSLAAALSAQEPGEG